MDKEVITINDLLEYIIQNGVEARVCVEAVIQSIDEVYPATSVNLREEYIDGHKSIVLVIS